MSEYIFGCSACSKFTGYIPRKTPPPKTINTTCGVCGARLRCSPSSYRVSSTRMSPKGKGAHHRTTSVFRIIKFDRSKYPHSSKKEASMMNRGLSDLAEKRAEPKSEADMRMFKPNKSGATGSFATASEGRFRTREDPLKRINEILKKHGLKEI